jgi:hypothetical protein
MRVHVWRGRCCGCRSTGVLLEKASYLIHPWHIGSPR